MDVNDFHNLHAGETIWVLGSGATLDFVDSSFFADKTVVGTNASGLCKNVDGYVVSNHWGSVQQGADAGYWSIGTETEQVPPQDQHPTRPQGDKVLLVPSISQRYAQFDPELHWPTPGTFVVGPSSLHLAMHWAVWLGAAHLVLVGADCGLIDNRTNLTGYYDDAIMPQVRKHQHHALWQNKLQRMAVKIRSMGVSVHSLNPWVTFGLEGHTWSQR